MIPIVTELVDGILVVRDDLVPGGTKARVIPLLFDDREEYVYAGPCQGYAQVALAHGAKAHGKRATLFCAKRAVRHRRTADAALLGATVHEVPFGYLSNVRAKAEAYCRETGAVMLPFGMDSPVIRNGLASIASTLEEPVEVWTVAGSGTLTLSLQQAWPNAVFNAVQIGKHLADPGRARVWVAPESFERDAVYPPPFPSCSNYDAKAWRFIKENARPGALFWNVAA